MSQSPELFMLLFAGIEHLHFHILVFRLSQDVGFQVALWRMPALASYYGGVSCLTNVASVSGNTPVINSRFCKTKSNGTSVGLALAC